MSDVWPTELFDSDEWPDEIRKPDAIYLPPASLFVDGVYVGECGESEIVPVDGVTPPVRITRAILITPDGPPYSLADEE